MNIPTWKKEIMKRRAEKEMTRIYNENTKEIQKIKRKLEKLMESKEDREQLNIMVILCSELISGFDKRNDQYFIVDMIRETLRNLDD